MFFKLLIMGLIAGAGVYYYDMNSAEKQIKEAVFSSMETDNRCKVNHESMCKYYLTVKLGKGGRDQQFYKFQVPLEYWHKKNKDGKLKDTKYRIVYKTKKILPGRIVGLEPKFQATLDKDLEKMRDNDM